MCFSLLALLQTVAEAFDKLERKEAPRDLGGKVRVLKQSMRKVEQACYSIQVRGSEIPKVGSIQLFSHVFFFPPDLIPITFIPRTTWWTFSPTSGRTRRPLAGEGRRMRKRKTSLINHRSVVSVKMRVLSCSAM